LEKNCTWCCDPVKIDKRYDIKIPKDETGNHTRKKREGELWISEEHPESVKLEIYDCLLYDENIKICRHYEKRPEICHNITCIQENNIISHDEQHTKLVTTPFMICKQI
jgi:Fe-S-cluster containining protein